MRPRFLSIALPTLGLVLSFAGDAAARCSACGYTGYSSGYYEQPVLVVRPPPVVLKPLEVTEYIPCGDGAVVNQGNIAPKRLSLRNRVVPATTRRSAIEIDEERCVQAR
jgi:hypothetical protein